MNRNFDNLKYTDEIMYSIKKNISLLGIVESFFSNLHINKPILKVYPNNKFFYNFCPFHNNSSTCHDFFVDERYHLYYCFGCGARGNAFDFLMSVYSLDINSVADILGAISGQFDVSILTEKELNIPIIKENINILEREAKQLTKESDNSSIQFFILLFEEMLNQKLILLNVVNMLCLSLTT